MVRGGRRGRGTLARSHRCGALQCPYCGVQLPPPPQRSFASDNASGAHPDVIAAIIAANEGHALAYGDDEWTRECHARFAELFGGGVETLLTFTGTGGNVLGLSTMLRPVDAVVCAAGSHVNVDEAGAMERIAGRQADRSPGARRQARPGATARPRRPLLGNEHHVQPAVVTITQSTELGTVYTAAEVAARCRDRPLDGDEGAHGRRPHRQRHGRPRIVRGHACGRSRSTPVSTCSRSAARRTG